jgi:hypothetical protein
VHLRPRHQLPRLPALTMPNMPYEPERAQKLRILAQQLRALAARLSNTEEKERLLARALELEAKAASIASPPWLRDGGNQ